MASDLIRYDLLAQEALRGVVRKVLADVARNGLPGEHHFFISFRTDAPGVRVSNRLRDRHPKEMTIVLQHQFWDLGVTDHAVEVGLSFGGVPERLLVPFEALTSFVDPSVPFGMKFETQASEEAGNDDGSESGEPAPTITHALPASLPQPSGGRLTAAETRKPARGAGSEPVVAAALPTKTAKEDGRREAKPKIVPEKTDAAKKPAGGKAPKPADGSAEVLSLDSFRKKK